MIEPSDLSLLSEAANFDSKSKTSINIFENNGTRFKNNMFVSTTPPPSPPFSIVNASIRSSSNHNFSDPIEQDNELYIPSPPHQSTTTSSILKSVLSRGLPLLLNKKEIITKQQQHQSNTFMIDIAPLKGITNNNDAATIKYIVVSVAKIKYPSCSMLFWAIDETLESYNVVCVYPLGTTFHDYDLTPIRKFHEKVIDVWIDISSSSSNNNSNERGKSDQKPVSPSVPQRKLFNNTNSTTSNSEEIYVKLCVSISRDIFGSTDKSKATINEIFYFGVDKKRKFT